MVKRREIAIVLLIALLLAGAWFAVSRLGTAQEEAQTRVVHDAVHNAALTCDAVEGAYPESLDYLRENYGLAYDEARYMVTYDAFAGNLMPMIYVVEVGADDA